MRFLNRHNSESRRREGRSRYFAALFYVVSAVAVAVAAVFSGLYIYGVMDDSVELVMYINGERAGYVDGRGAIENACDMLTERIYRNTGALYKYEGIVSYGMETVDGEVEYLTAEDCLRLISESVDMAYEEGWGLYIDGVLSGVCSSEAEIEYALDKTLESENALFGSADVKATVTSEIQINKCLARSGELLTGEELFQALSARSNSIPSWYSEYEQKKGEYTEAIALFNLSQTEEGQGKTETPPLVDTTEGANEEDAVSAPSDTEDEAQSEAQSHKFTAITFSFTLPLPGGLLLPSFEKVESVGCLLARVEGIINRDIDYGISPCSLGGYTEAAGLAYEYECTLTKLEDAKSELVYEYNENRLESYGEVKTEGSDGVSSVTYRLRCDCDGIIESTRISSDPLIECVDTVVVVGTRAQTEPGVFTSSLMWPVYYDGEPIITSYYGARRPEYDGGGYHLGIDIYKPVGTDVYAADGGVVSYVDFTSSYGNMIIIDHDGDQFQTVYAHLDYSLVQVGDLVYGGQLIAKSGQSGAASGPHLHFEVRTELHTRDPFKYLPDY